MPWFQSRNFEMSCTVNMNLIVLRLSVDQNSLSYHGFHQPHVLLTARIIGERFDVLERRAKDC